mmetsp:Transcript_70546/g.228489  ORF Transcript_70546/g.228489 Transcript_70546/m.228489 type:complete len:841 (-) Transcript_70546:76-2598(-)
MDWPSWLEWFLHKLGDVFLGKEIAGRRLLPRACILAAVVLLVACIRIYLAILLFGLSFGAWYAFCKQYCWFAVRQLWRMEQSQLTAKARSALYQRWQVSFHAQPAGGPPAKAPAPGPRQVVPVRTSLDPGERFAVQPPVQLSRGGAFKGEKGLIVDSTVRYQTYIGFGGAFTESSASVLERLSSANQERVVDAYFCEGAGLGYNMGRLHMNSCDFSDGNWSCCDTPGEKGSELKDFSVQRYETIIFPMVRRAVKAAGKPLLLLASPWSPPAWMKDTGTMLVGGKLKAECRSLWAEFYVRFARALEAAGLPLWAFTVQNEPDAQNSWENCLFSPEEERDFIRDHLGPALESSGMDLKLIGWDHNRDDLFLRARTIYNDPAAAKHVWGMGYHWYGDPRAEWWADAGSQVCFNNVAAVHDLRPEKHIIVTETCQELGPHIGDWAVAERYAESIITDFNNWCEGWIDWNLLLDETGGPNHVGNCCSAPIIADTVNDRVLLQPSYYYIGHFSRYIQPGAQRVLCTANRDCLEATAFVNPDETLVVVVMNRTEDGQDFALQHAGFVGRVQAPPHSITTFTLNIDPGVKPPPLSWLTGQWVPTRMDTWWDPNLGNDQRTLHEWDDQNRCSWCTGDSHGIGEVIGKIDDMYEVKYTTQRFDFFGTINRLEDDTYELRLNSHWGGKECMRRRTLEEKDTADFNDLVEAMMREDMVFILGFQGNLNALGRYRNDHEWDPPPPPAPHKYTALCAAAANGKARSVEALLQAGADPSVPDELGGLPEGIARAVGHIRISFLIHTWKSPLRQAEASAGEAQDAPSEAQPAAPALLPREADPLAPEEKKSGCGIW